MSLNSPSFHTVRADESVETLCYHVISLGCPKNLVDTEQMMAHLAMSGLIYTPDMEEADILLVNTCGFIDSAKAESIDAMEELIELRQPRQRIIATGCLVQRYRAELLEQFPEIDAFVPLRGQSGVAKVAWELLGRSVPDQNASSQAPFAPRLLTTPAHMAYLRIADGCFHQCAFCAIPSFRGPLRSRPIEQIVAEANALVQGGARELILIAQDSTSYGYDLYGRFRLVELLSELECIDDLRWLRLMYTYPTLVDRRLVQFYKSSQKLVRYVDIPIQHGSAEVLQAMRRGSNPDLIRKVIANLREAKPGMSIRTTIIVGYPGETEAHVDEMMELLEELQCENVGVFRYSDEDGTPAQKLPDKVPEAVQDERYERLVAWASAQARERNRRYIGRMLEVLVDRVDPVDNRPWGRHEGQAPECDGQVCITSGAANPGEFVKVRITEADEENLYGIRHSPPDGT